MVKKMRLLTVKQKTIKAQIRNLWDNLPIFRDSKHKVPTIHIPNKKELIRRALNDSDFMIGTKGLADVYFYNC
jgi:hypothetical protein